MINFRYDEVLYILSIELNLILICQQLIDDDDLGESIVEGLKQSRKKLIDVISFDAFEDFFFFCFSKVRKKFDELIYRVVSCVVVGVTKRLRCEIADFKFDVIVPFIADYFLKLFIRVVEVFFVVQSHLDDDIV